ncbi:MAG: hypothetical protein KY475_24355 [Planctomycetes bacterium]|nr:hypothetical protein [Planctomycetota bacterium]
MTLRMLLHGLFAVGLLPAAYWPVWSGHEKPRPASLATHSSQRSKGSVRDWVVDADSFLPPATEQSLAFRVCYNKWRPAP